MTPRVEQVPISEERFEYLVQFLKERLRPDYSELGQALREVRDLHQYLPDTIDDFCRAQFDISVRHAERYITAEEIARHSMRVLGQRPASEGVAREMVSLKTAEELKAVQAELKKQNLTVATANMQAMRRAVKAIIGDDKQPRKFAPKKARPA